jgi:hypothetical protein
MKFLIQTIDGKVKHDFSFILLESIEYNNWLRNEEVFQVSFTDYEMIPNCIPIGSVEFVSKYIKEYYGIEIKPKNIPIELIDRKWTNRIVINGTEKDIIGEKFVKSNDKIKSFTEICKSAPAGNYQISDVISIQSEWRAFVYKKKLVGLQNYSGRFDIFPNVEKIEEMIYYYTNQPVAYTLDIGISLGETVIIEVHDFFSCGLYGFCDHKILPYMFSNWFYSFIGKINY